MVALYGAGARLRWTGLAACCALTLWTGNAAAQTVYRCGPEGRSYSQQPCDNGQVLQLKDDRSAEQQQQARQGSASNRALADRLARERRAREASAASAIGFNAQPLPPAPVSRFTAPAGRNPATKKSRGSAADDRGFVAEVPGTQEKARKKSGKKAAPAD